MYGENWRGRKEEGGRSELERYIERPREFQREREKS